MRPAITQETVLAYLKEKGRRRFVDFLYDFLLDREGQYTRLEQTLEKLIMQKKVEVIKTASVGDFLFAQDWQRAGSMFRYYSFELAKKE